MFDDASERQDMSSAAQAYGMFVFSEETRTYWFSGASMEAGTEFRLVGQLMGLAIFNSVILDAHFPHCLHMKLLGLKPGFEVDPQRLTTTAHRMQVCCCPDRALAAGLRHPLCNAVPKLHGGVADLQSMQASLTQVRSGTRLSGVGDRHRLLTGHPQCRT